MKNKILKIKSEILNKLAKVKDMKALADFEIKVLGRKGDLTKLLRGLSELDEAKRREAGQLANQTKQELVARFKELKDKLGIPPDSGFVDVTLPGQRIERGHIHPITQVQNELEDLFTSLGFMILDGPELESDFYNFTALNFPPDHPARDMQDTFFVKKPHQDEEEVSNLVMRTQTSPVQVRAMQKYGAPIRCVVPGRVFRAEATDTVHEHTFGQMEGLVVDENISIANLIAVMKELIDGILGPGTVTRVRPGYFPFVEPAIEMDIQCTICNGAKCPGCKNSGWLELLPAGMIHPNVLKYGGLDPNKYSGFAFGLGLTRLAMMKYKIDDIRLFNSGDLRFLEQF